MHPQNDWLAQLVEQRPFKPWVPSSSLGPITKKAPVFRSFFHLTIVGCRLGIFDVYLRFYNKKLSLSIPGTPSILGTSFGSFPLRRSTCLFIYHIIVAKTIAMKTSLKNRILVTSIVILLSFSNLHAQVEIKVHYLGHAAFVLDFHDAIRVLTDFGTSNCWGYDSPIYGIGDFIPLVMSYSHEHPDHYDPDRIPSGVPYTIDLIDSLNIMDLWIHPVRTCETTPGVESNTSFIFDYLGFKICHLGDAQAEIMNIADPAQQALILEKFPERIDLLFMTIEGVYPFIPEAEMFIDLLQPGMVVPIHYWSPQYKEDFLTYLELQNDTAGKNYEVNRLSGPELNVLSDDTLHTNIRVFGLSPFPYGETGIDEAYVPIQDISIYPNPASGRTTLLVNANIVQEIIYQLICLGGHYAAPEERIFCHKGLNRIELNLENVTAGIYFLNIRYEGHSETKKLVIFP